jgi:plastocyanin
LRKFAVLLALAALAVAATQAFAAATVTTGVRDDFFAKSKLTVAKGTTVVWKWKSTEDPHTVTEARDKPRFGSKQKTKGSYQHTFKRAGTYRVYCKVHPTSMRQKIVVK